MRFHPFLSPPFSPAAWKHIFCLLLKHLIFPTLQQYSLELWWEILQHYSPQACEACCPAEQRGCLPGCPAGVRLWRTTASWVTGRSWVSLGWRWELPSVWGAVALSVSAAAASGRPPPAAPGGRVSCSKLSVHWTLKKESDLSWSLNG